ncbi:MAG: hypothetical protein U5N56_12600 [Candidatus Marinimicrobia bacterium]|nr:hypothetical protein [Candidatus Neomarinimicrobiota bacterium]
MKKSYLKAAWEAINDPDTHVIAQVASRAVWVAIGEEFRYAAGNDLHGQDPWSGASA